jgi:hypothetical protein
MFINVTKLQRRSRSRVLLGLTISGGILLFGFSLAASTISNRSPRWVEWVNHRWFVQQQHDSIAQSGLPTFFVHSIETGLFYPVFVFYGSSLYAVTGYISQAIGVEMAYMLLWPLALVISGISGFLFVRWIGCSLIQQLALGLAFATYPYLITNGFARFALTEYIALVAITVFIAGVACLFARNRYVGCGLIILGAAALTGSHNITSVWAIAVAIVVLFAAAITLPSRLFSKDLLLGLLATFVGVGLNAWFLMPAFFLRNTVSITTSSEQDFFSMRDNNLVSARLLFSPYPDMPSVSGTPNLNLNLPSLFLLVVVGFVGAMVLRKVWRPKAAARRSSLVPRRLMVVLSCPLALLLGVLLIPEVQSSVPGILAHIQFTYRLVGISSILVLLLCGVMERVIPRAWVFPYVLLVVMASLTQAAFAGYYIAKATPSTVAPQLLEDFGSHAPPTLYGLNAYRDLRSVNIAPIVSSECYLSSSPSRVVNERAVYVGSGLDSCVSNASPFRGKSIFGTDSVYSPFVEVASPAAIIGADRDGFVLVSVPEVSPKDFVVHQRVPTVAAWGVALTCFLSVIVIIAFATIFVRRVRGGRRRMERATQS